MLFRLAQQSYCARVGTPNKDISSKGKEKPSNPFHFNEFTIHEFSNLLDIFFNDVTLYSQLLAIPVGTLKNLARKITKSVSIPTIGIGASRYCDGQILVTEDMLGLSDFSPKFVKQYTNLNKIMEKSIKNYVKDVKMRRFPSFKNVYR